MNLFVFLTILLAINLTFVHDSVGHWTYKKGTGLRWLKHDEHGKHEGPVTWKWDFLKPTQITDKERQQYESDLYSKGHEEWPGWSKGQRCEHEAGYPHPKGDCTRFLHCKGAGQKPQVKRCRPNLLFDPFEEKCVKKTDARPCSVCLGRDGFTTADPIDNHGQRFFQCAEGIPHHYECITGKFFHPLSGKCESRKLSKGEVEEEEVIEHEEADPKYDVDPKTIKEINLGTKEEVIEDPGDDKEIPVSLANISDEADDAPLEGDIYDDFKLN